MLKALGFLIDSLDLGLVNTALIPNVRFNPTLVNMLSRSQSILGQRDLPGAVIIAAK